jgi:hypothetical protein
MCCTAAIGPDVEENSTDSVWFLNGPCETELLALVTKLGRDLRVGGTRLGFEILISSDHASSLRGCFSIMPSFPCASRQVSNPACLRARRNPRLHSMHRWRGIISGLSHRSRRRSCGIRSAAGSPAALRTHAPMCCAWWRWKSRNRGARPRADPELPDLIQRMCKEMSPGACRASPENPSSSVFRSRSTVTAYARKSIEESIAETKAVPSPLSGQQQ